MISKIGIVNVRLGNDVSIIEPVNLYNCEIGDQTFIGPFVEIQTNVVVGKRVKIQSHTFICDGVTIGDGCFIGHGVMFVNDKFSIGTPARGNTKLWEKTNLANNVYVGSNATILPVEICSDVVIGAGSVVTKNITSPGKYVGNPARKINENDKN